MLTKTKKILLVLLCSAVIFTFVSCSKPEEGEKEEKTSIERTSEDTKAQTEETQITLEDVNHFLNTSADLGPGTVVNPVSIIPMKHIDGPKNNIDVYAFVTFEHEARDFIKYQVSYISCTCRPANYNYWTTAYMEFTLPESKNPKDAILKTLSFDRDSGDKYNGGMWGDSDPIPSGMTYETIKTEYVPYFIGKNIGYLKNLDTIEDIHLSDYQQGEGREAYTLDAYTGATVSTNNIIRIILAMADYHANNPFFKQ